MNRNDDHFSDFESAELGQTIANLAKMEAPSEAVERVTKQASLQPTPAKIIANEQQTTWRRWVSLAVAAMIVVGLFSVTAFWQTNDLFANMQQAIESQNFRCVTRIIDDQNNTLGTIQSYVDESGSIRQEIENGPVVVADFQVARMLTLEEKARIATVAPIVEVDSNRNFFFEVVRVLTGDLDGNSREVGTIQDGEKTLVQFEVEGVNIEAQVFIDLETSLPEKVVLPQGDLTKIVLTDFEFDLNLNRELFSLTPPDDYEIELLAREPETAAMVLSPVNGLGPIGFGATQEQVVEALGQPDSQFQTDIEVFTSSGPVTKQKTVLIYDSRGFQIQIHPDQGVFLISCFDRRDGQMGTRRFNGSFIEQIEFEMSIAEVESLLGEPYLREDLTETKPNGTLTYYDETLNTTTHISFRNNQVISFSVFKGD